MLGGKRQLVAEKDWNMFCFQHIGDGPLAKSPQTQPAYSRYRIPGACTGQSTYSFADFLQKSLMHPSEKA